MNRNFLSKIFGDGPYTFFGTRTDRGYGSENNAFGRPYAPIESGQYGSRYNVRRDMSPLPMQGDLIVYQSLPSVDLKANAVYFGGTFQSTSLNAPPGN